MPSSPFLAFLLPLSVIGAAIVFFATGNALFAVLFFAIDAVTVTFIYVSQLRTRRTSSDAELDRLTRYSNLDTDQQK